MAEKTCGDCIHAEVCEVSALAPEFCRDNPAYCRGFKDVVDFQPVRHGQWEMHNQVDSVFYCSKCKLNVSGFERRWLNYCPNCGAKMDKEDDDG